MDNSKIKFITKDKIVEKLESLLRERNENTPSKVTNCSFDPAFLVECPRRLIYKTNEIYNGYSNSHIQTEKLIKNKWIDYLQKCKGIRVIETNIQASDCNYSIVGYAHAVIEYAQYILVVQIKPIKHSRFIEVQQDTPFKRDIVELMTLMWMLEINDGILIYEDLDDQEFSIFHITGQNLIIDTIRKKCISMLEFKRKGELPPQPYTNNSYKECKQCEFRKKCWKTK